MRQQLCIHMYPPFQREVDICLFLWLRVSVIGQMMLGIIMGKAKPRAGRSSSLFLAYVLFRLRF